MTIWVYRTPDGRPHWTAEYRYARGNRQVTEVVTEKHVAMMRDVFPMSTDEWCSLRVRAGLPMYPPTPERERDTRYGSAVNDFLVRALTP